MQPLYRCAGHCENKPKSLNTSNAKQNKQKTLGLHIINFKACKLTSVHFCVGSKSYMKSQYSIYYLNLYLKGREREKWISHLLGLNRLNPGALNSIWSPLKEAASHVGFASEKVGITAGLEHWHSCMGCRRPKRRLSATPNVSWFRELENEYQVMTQK